VRHRLALACLVALAGAQPARAQVIREAPPVPFPDPRRFARGFFAEGDLGAVIFVGKLGDYASPGPTLGARLGYDVARWFALQAHVAGSFASADLPSPYGQSFQMYLYAGEARAQLQLRRVGLYVDAGAGAVQISSNVLETRNIDGKTVGVTSPGQRFSFAVLAGAGIDLHTLNRHFSLGLAADYLFLGQFISSHAVTVGTYLRYTH
jgi:hypothetical protein